MWYLIEKQEEKTFVTLELERKHKGFIFSKGK